jgi:hypothetical protein
LTTSSPFVVCWTGKSAGSSPKESGQHKGR